ncbi:uncharacterized protein EV420DRAFT_1475290 [Desarmillaria tabescens]|uniref:GST N-terminal domain-containing protein n=1 Tax=Armillaria tabescens TaxID=1929756 RepID=A0AA39NG78_ARMTA|nr:uncharacterized protein EV420DRAFT_1475290 [Desarmillaria tabescens]KAK0465051.1 hypothetical protein EV420DRAFT_1475290 [Desarmillaria tabescens]
MSSVPKAVLYYSSESIWSSAVHLSLEEKGYGADEVDLRVVDLGEFSLTRLHDSVYSTNCNSLDKGENFAPSFLRLSNKGLEVTTSLAMVPTLVVPLQKTLSEDVESRYRAITESKAIIEFLDKSRSPWSQTHTTSSAPAPSLTPATIAFTETSAELIELVHTDEVNPNNLEYMNARDTDSLKNLAREMLPVLHTRRAVLSKYISDADSGKIQISEKTTALWKEKKAATEVLLGLYKNADVSESALNPEEKSKRAEYFEMARCARASLGRALLRLQKDIIGPFALGDQLSIADMHLSAWLASIVKLAGGAATDNGSAMVGRLQEYIGTEFILGKQGRLSQYWEAMKERPSWKKVYAEGLH